MKEIVLMLALVLTLSGCSTAIHGTADDIIINSLEKDTLIYVDGVKRGLDDALVQVKRGQTHSIKVEKSGCEPVLIETGEKFDATTLLGVLVDFGVITIPVDLISGAAWKTYPTRYTVTPICLTDSEARQFAISPAD